ncbi:MAG: tyrosine-type recombinase/integrase [Thermoplasmata archaeon]|nr:tyrosine-type recombinase/integrase [Thermoplasmata archaeon]
MGKKLPKYIREEELKAILRAPRPERQGYTIEAIQRLHGQRKKHLKWNGPRFPLELRDKTILEMLYRTGMRNSELRNLKWEHIDFNTQTVTIINGKGGKDRVVWFDDTLTLWLEKLKGEMETGYVFLSSHTGDKLSGTQLRNIVKKYARRAGLRHASEYVPHMLRHSFAVHYLKSGANLRTLQKALGHASIQTTQIYLDVANTDVEEDMRRHPLP